MKYSIHITKKAEQDLVSAADYIEFTLMNPQAADSLLNEAALKIGELADFPERNALLDDAVLKAWDIRFVIVKNYLVFYTISENAQTVYILRFLYQKRDWISILKEGITFE